MPDTRLRMTPSPSSSRKTTSSPTVSDEWSDKSATDASVTYGRTRPVETNEGRWRTYLSLWGFAAAVRLLYLAAAHPAFAIYYWEAASGLRRDGTLSIDGVRTAALEPLYPVFLAAARWLVQDRPLLVQGIQALVASIGAVYLYKLAIALAGRRQVGIAAAVLFAVYPLLVRHALDGTESALATLFLIVFAYRFVTMERTLDAAAAGAWLALAILTRVVALPLILIAPVLAATRRGGRAATTMAGVAVLVLMPYAIRNYVLNGAIVSVRGGLNLFISNNEYSAGVMAGYGPDILVPYAGSRLAAEGLANLPVTPEAERQEDEAYQRLALSEIMERPLDTLRLKIVNVFLFFSPVLVPLFAITDATHIHLGASGQSTVTNGVPRPHFDHIVYSASYSAVLALAAIGLYVRRRDLRADAILWCVLFTFAAVHAVYFPSTRYRAPVDFVFLFYAGVGVVTLMERWR